MRFRKAFWLQVLCVLALVALAGVPCLFAATEEAEVSGTVLASEWDASNNVTAVVIFTSEGEEILVSNAGKGLELLKLEDKSVTASGAVVTDEEGRRTITVTRYMIQE